MQSVIKHHDHITQAVSDDGRIAVLQTPTSRLFGNFSLRDNATGEGMWRGYYLDAAGKCTDRQVPADVWSAVVALTNEIEALNGAAEDASAKRAAELADARWNSESARIAADMDRPGSDL